LKHPYFKVSQDFIATTATTTSSNPSDGNGSAKYRDSKQIFTDDWQTDEVSIEKKIQSSHDNLCF
jgi:hypothetical protein